MTSFVVSSIRSQTAVEKHIEILWQYSPYEIRTKHLWSIDQGKDEGKKRFKIPQTILYYWKKEIMPHF